MFQQIVPICVIGNERVGGGTAVLTGGSSESPEDDELATTLETIFGGGWEKDVGTLKKRCSTEASYPKGNRKAKPTGTATGGAATNGFGEF